MKMNNNMVLEFRGILELAGAGYSFIDDNNPTPRVGAIIMSAEQPLQLDELFDESDDCHVLIGNELLVDNHSSENPVIYWDLKLFRS